MESDIDQFAQAAESHIATAHEIALLFHDMLQGYKIFQDALIEVGGPERIRILKRIRRLDATEQPWRNHYKFSGAGSAARATAFVSRDPPPSGVLWVENHDDETLNININNLNGRLQIIASGNVQVQNATVADPSRDVLIIVSYG